MKDFHYSIVIKLLFMSTKMIDFYYKSDQHSIKLMFTKMSDFYYKSDQYSIYLLK